MGRPLVPKTGLDLRKQNFHLFFGGLLIAADELSSQSNLRNICGSSGRDNGRRLLQNRIVLFWWIDLEGRQLFLKGLTIG